VSTGRVRRQGAGEAIPTEEGAVSKGPSVSPAGLLLPLGSMALVVALWYLIVVAFGIPQYILPRPDAVFASMWENRADLLAQAAATGRVAASGLLVSLLLGVPLGFAIARYRVLRRLLMPPIVAIQSIPKVALAPLFVAWLGFGVGPKLIIAVLITFFPLTLAAIVGIESITMSTSYLARSIGCRSTSLLRYIWLPTAAPYVAAAFRTSATLAVVGTLVAEFVGSIDGLGNLLLIASGNRDTTLAFGAILTVALLGVLFYAGGAVLARASTVRLPAQYMKSTAS
jgi:ABC-type nitrate/sulfonate/bicarbonate transport system permease component